MVKRIFASYKIVHKRRNSNYRYACQYMRIRISRNIYGTAWVSQRATERAYYYRQHLSLFFFFFWNRWLRSDIFSSGLERRARVALHAICVTFLRQQKYDSTARLRREGDTRCRGDQPVEFTSQHDDICVPDVRERSCNYANMQTRDRFIEINNW